jgi:hypothetical protein
MIIYMDGSGDYEFSLELKVDKQIYDDNQPEHNSLYPLVITVGCGMTLLVVAFFVFLLKPIIQKCKDMKEQKIKDKEKKLKLERDAAELNNEDFSSLAGH